jgi:glycosyltransferase involved in cell wall biosynthesis
VTDATGGSTSVPQRLTLVLPSTAEFDSRTYRIASAAVARGHAVTVIARWRPGLPAEEQHPGGYRILRVPFSAIDGLPFPGIVRSGRAGLRRLHAWRTRTPYRPPVDPMAVMRAAGSRAAAGYATSAAASDTGTGGFDGPAAPPSSGVGTRKASLPRRVASSLVRRLSIFLTIRSQGRFAAQVAPPADLYHGMAYMGVPIALRLARRDRAKVVYDARDIYLDAANLARMRGPMRWFIARSERGWARSVDRVITVNRPYAEVMTDRFGVPEPLIILNCSYRFTPPSPRPRRFHEALGLDPSAAVVLYQGGFSRDRGIEQLLEAIPGVPGAVLVLMGYGNLEEHLRAEEAKAGGRVRVLPAVPPAELLSWVASADVVAMPIQPSTLNHRLTTPNKLFEAMAAGVPIVASDLPGMAPYVLETECGVLCDPTNPAALAAAIRSLVDAPADERGRLGANALRAAHDRYNWETQVARLFAEYGRLTGSQW